MTTIVVAGDCATTTSIALAAGWPEHGPDASGAHHQEVVIVEADPSGGSLAAWCDMPLSPSLSSVVTTLHQTAATATTPWHSIEPMIRRSTSGVRFLPAPFRAREARGAITEAERLLFPLLARTTHLLAILDVGRLDPNRIPAACREAAMTVVVHRQDTSSAPAATVRLERLAEQVAALSDSGNQVAVAVIGREPFDIDEIIKFVAPDTLAWELPVDPLAAAVFAGHRGVSARRLTRLPLSRDAARIGRELAHFLDRERSHR